MTKLVCMGGNNKGDQFLVHEGLNTVGRSHDCTVVLFDKKCSRQHFQIVKKGNRYSVKDLDSLNGTSLNGKILDRTYSSCKIGDIIKAGDTILKLSDKAIGNVIDQTATDVAEELQTGKYDKVLSETYNALKKGQYKLKKNAVHGWRAFFKKH